MASKLNSNRVIKLVSATLFLMGGLGLYFHQMLGSGHDSISDSADFLGGAHEIKPELERALDVDEQGLSRGAVVLQTTRGRIRFKFYSKDAPKTVHRFAELVSKGFYNGLIFHRVVPGFVIQGGDPTGTGMGGSGMALPAEFNGRKHVPGTVAMARAQDPNSADSQFYISLGTHPQLDGAYTVFGQLIEGQEVANQIQVGDRMTSVSIEER